MNLWSQVCLLTLTQKMDTELDSCLFYFERIGMNDLF